MSVWFRGAVIATALVTAGVAAASGADASLPKHATQVTVRAGHTVSHIDASMTAGSAIAGQVTDVDNNPLANAQVEVLTAKGQTEAYTTTDSNGDYRAANLPPSAKGYAVCVNGATASSAARPVSYGYVAQCNGSMQTWMGTQPPSDARFVSTAVGQTSTANLILVDGGALTGTVTSREGGKKLDANGSLFSASGRAEGGFSVSKGLFTASGLAPGKYVVCFSSNTAASKGHTGFLSQCYHDKSWIPGSMPPAKATKVTVASGAATEVDQSLPAAAAVAGKVRNAKTRSGTSTAVVAVYLHGKTLALDVPDNDGTYDIQDLPIATVDVCALPVHRQQLYASDLLRRRADRPVSALAARRFSVASTKGEAGQCWKHTPWNGKGSIPKAAQELQLHRNVTTSGIDLTVTPTTFSSHITGHIRNTDGGLRGAGVTAFGPHGTFIATTTSGKGGAYRLSVPASTKPGYVVCAGPAQETSLAERAHRNSSRPVLASECWRKTAWSGSGPPPTGAPKVTVASRHTTSGIDITLPRTGAIAGAVTYHGAPVPNLEIDVFDHHGNFENFGRTDAQGDYKVTGLSPAPGYVVCFDTRYFDTDTPYGLRPQCYSNQAWDGFNY